MNTISQAYFLGKINFCVFFIIKSMVVALDVFLINQLFCLYLQDHQTEKPTELDKGQPNVNTISQACHS